MAYTKREWHVVLWLGTGNLYTVSTHVLKEEAEAAARQMNASPLPDGLAAMLPDLASRGAIVIHDSDIVDLGETLIV